MAVAHRVKEVHNGVKSAHDAALWPCPSKCSSIIPWAAATRWRDLHRRCRLSIFIVVHIASVHFERAIRRKLEAAIAADQVKGVVVAVNGQLASWLQHQASCLAKADGPAYRRLDC